MHALKFNISVTALDLSDNALNYSALFNLGAFPCRSYSHGPLLPFHLCFFDAMPFREQCGFCMFIFLCPPDHICSPRMPYPRSSY